jgi:hypothetical protein
MLNISMQELGIFSENLNFLFLFLPFFLDPRNLAVLNPLQNKENCVFLKQTSLPKMYLHYRVIAVCCGKDMVQAQKLKLKLEEIFIRYREFGRDRGICFEESVSFTIKCNPHVKMHPIPAADPMLVSHFCY